jgi:small GTP-binding protein
LVKEIDLDNNHVRIVVWDIAGQPRFSKLRKFYFKGSQGAFGVFDVTNPQTLIDIVDWVRSFRKAVGTDIPLILLGNKIDLDRQVEISEAQDLAKELNCEYLETSAKSGENVEATFEKIARVCIDKSKIL